MAIRTRCMQVMSICFLMVPMANAHKGSAVFSTGETLAYELGHSVESMFAQLPLDAIDQNLIALALEMSYGKTPAQVIQGVADFCNSTGIPLMKAAQVLVKQHNYIGAALDAAQCLADALPIQSPDRADVQGWIDDLSMMQTALEYVILVIKSNPQLVAAVIKIVA